ncbi:MAG: hypothetical protein RMJ36_00395 [Candidatus Calescibacterium sp.]|nr:hypothetical protein [Candidatus Calescibacterium sp.]MDW8132104.1 hypothetical protein [Candidatus Calescibacterium sp.]
MEATLNKVYKSKQNYFYVIQKLMDRNEILNIISDIFKMMDFSYYSFESFQYIGDIINDKPISILSPSFYISKDKKELFLVEFFSDYGNTVFVLHYYSMEDGFDYHEKINSIFNEVMKKYGINSVYFNYKDIFKISDKNILNFFMKDINIDLLRIVKEYKIDREKLDFDKYFIDSRVISVSYSVLKGNYSDISLEDLKYMELLEKNNFLKIFVVFKCSSTRASIFQMNKLDNVGILLESFRCPVCGKKLSEENREINLTVSPFFDIYFTNYIWLKNVIFDYFISSNNMNVYEYDKDVYLIRYMDSLYLAVFTDYNNLLSSLSYYKDVEILNLSHSFFFIINYENNSINFSLVDKFKEKITLINMNKENFSADNFRKILVNIKEKIEDIYNMKQFGNIVVSINYPNLLMYSSKQVSREEEVVLEVIHSEEEELVYPIVKEEEKFIMETKSISDERQVVFSEEKQETESQLYSEIVEIQEPYQIQEITVNKDQEELVDVLENIIKKEKSELIDDLNIQKTIQEQSIISENLTIEEEKKSVEDILDEINLSMNYSIEQAVEEKTPARENWEELLVINKETQLKEDKKEDLYKPINIDDLLKDVKVNFRSELGKDLILKDMVSIFYHLLAGMSKEKLAFIEKNIQYFRQSMQIKDPDLKYHICIISPKGLNIFPRDEIILINYYQPVMGRLYDMKDYYISDRELYSFCINKNTLFFNLFYNAVPNIIVSSFVLEVPFNSNMVYSYPAELKELKIDIIKRVTDNLNNLKVSEVIKNFVILNEEFEYITENNSFDSSVIYKTYNYYNLYSVIEPIVWGWGGKEGGFYLALRFNNVFLVVHTKEFSFNEIVNLYNSLYLLEIL